MTDFNTGNDPYNNNSNNNAKNNQFGAQELQNMHNMQQGMLRGQNGPIGFPNQQPGYNAGGGFGGNNNYNNNGFNNGGGFYDNNNGFGGNMNGYNNNNNGFGGGNYTPIKINDRNRAGFIRKVYGILTAQLCVTAFIVSYVVSDKQIQEYLKGNPAILIITMIVSLTTCIILACCQDVARSVPINYILLGFFTLAESILVAVIASDYDPKKVMIAALMTAAITIALTAYACTTDTDFTICGGLLFMVLLGLIVASIISIFWPNEILTTAISYLGAVLFGIYIIYDTQLILGKHSQKLSIDDYIFAAMNLYIDIIQLFIYILEILGKDN